MQLGAGITEIEDMPDDIELMWHETFRKRTGPRARRAAQKLSVFGACIDVLNAINNAAGVRIFELPATPEKVKAANGNQGCRKRNQA